MILDSGEEREKPEYICMEARCTSHDRVMASGKMVAGNEERALMSRN